ncbi:hypothetical protein D3C72_1621320 [compost metagenome]
MIGQVGFVQDFEDQAVIAVAEPVADVRPQLFQDIAAAVFLQTLLMVGVEDHVEARLGQGVVDDRRQGSKARGGEVDAPRVGVREGRSADILGPGDGYPQVAKPARIIGVNLGTRRLQSGRMLGVVEHLAKVEPLAHMRGGLARGRRRQALGGMRGGGHRRGGTAGRCGQHGGAEHGGASPIFAHRMTLPTLF